MMAILDSLLAGLPHLLLHSILTFAILGMGLAVYISITPHKELALVRDGNTAAAVSLGGAVVGLALPLSFCLAFAVSASDIIVWGAVTLGFQLAAFFIADFVLRDLSKRIAEGQMSSAIFLVSIKLATAFVNAAAISG